MQIIFYLNRYMADWSVKYDSFRLNYANFPCMNFDSTISIFFLCGFESNILILKYPIQT